LKSFLSKLKLKARKLGCHTETRWFLALLSNLSWRKDISFPCVGSFAPLPRIEEILYHNSLLNYLRPLSERESTNENEKNMFSSFLRRKENFPSTYDA
jgi:hypothetical protein